MNVCHYCNRSFSNTVNLNRHKLGSCMWIHTSKKDKHDFIDSYEPAFTDSQRDGFIRKLLFEMSKMNMKMTQMQKEIQYLKQKQKLQIVKILNSEKVQPTKHIIQWVKTINISQMHLEYVFRNNMEEGILHLLKDTLETMNNLRQHTPIRGYNKKPKHLFVYFEYENEIKWKLCDYDSFQKICKIISSRFIELFMTWQSDNADYLLYNEESQEQVMLFMQKVMDSGFLKHTGKMIEKLYNKINTELELNDYEFE